MQNFGLDENVAYLGLRAIKSIAMADGTFETHEKNLIQAASDAFGLKTDVDALPTIAPEELAAELQTPLLRERVIQAQIIMAIIDGEVSPSELSILQSFAHALDIDEPRLDNLRQLMNGHLRYVQMDLMRKSKMLNDVMRTAWEKERLCGIWKHTAPVLGIGGGDPSVAEQYIRLGELPEGTLGRAYFLHMNEREFSFPGEVPGLPEGFLKHDICHVLAGYDTDIPGEVEVVSFICGSYERDPFSYFFMLALHAHLDVEIFQGDATGKFALDPARALAALERGMKVNRDLYDEAIDWWAYFPRPLEDVRKELNIEPKA